MKYTFIPKLLLLSTLILSTVSQPSVPNVAFSFQYSSDAPINGVFGELNVYWNNAHILYLTGFTTNIGSVWGFLTPRVGINTFSFVLNTSKGIPMYIDNLKLTFNSAKVNVTNGDCETAGGWLESNLNINTFPRYPSKLIRLDSTSYVATQIFLFDSNLNILTPLSNPSLPSNNFYMISFDYAARVDVALDHAALMISYNGLTKNIQTSDYDKYTYFDITPANPGKNYLSLYPVNPNTFSSIAIDNVRVVKVGTT